MPMPDAIPVSGKFVTHDGTPAAGRIKFVPSVPVIRIPGDQVIATGGVVGPFELTNDGEVPVGVALLPTDDPDTVPQYWHWTVVEDFVGQRRRQWELSIASTETSVDLSQRDRGEHFTDPITVYLSTADFASLRGQPNGLATLDEDGDVPLSQLGNVVGAGGGRYVHTQSTPAASWPISHDLGAKPIVQILVDNKVGITDVEHNSDDSCTAVFAEPTAGEAILIV